MRKLFTFLSAFALTLAGSAHAEQKRPLVIKNGVTQQIQTGDTLTVQPSTTDAASVNIPQGTAPTSPSNGDCWLTSAGGFVCRVNGASIPAGAIYTETATGGGARSLADKASERSDVSDFSGCDFTGATDSTTCVQNALNKFASNKGGVLNFKGVLRLSSNLTIPPGVSLRGQCEMPGSPGTSNASAPYGSLTCGVIKLASTATINLSGSSNVSSAVIYRDGMTFPAANSSAFAGTAFTAAGEDVSLYKVLVMGFNKGFYASGYQRPRIEYWYGDNNNGIEIANSLDIPWLSHIHQWPFATIATGGSYTNHIRSGNAIYLHDTVDWAHVTDCFSWGYFRGIRIQNANSTSIVACGADNPFTVGPDYANSIGLVVEGNSSDTRIVGFQAAAQATAGIYVNTTAGLSTVIQDATFWGGSSHAVLVDGGNASIQGGVVGGLNSVQNGVTINTTTGRVYVEGVTFGTLTGSAINTPVANSTSIISGNNFGGYSGSVAGANLTSASVASASEILAPPYATAVNITGTTNIGTIEGGWAGREITLFFGSALTVLNSTGAYGAIRLSGAANFAVTAGGTLTLRHNGVQWYEIGRGS